MAAQLNKAVADALRAKAAKTTKGAPTRNYVSFSNEEWTKVVAFTGSGEKSFLKSLIMSIVDGEVKIG